MHRTSPILKRPEMLYEQGFERHLLVSEEREISQD